MCTIFLIGERGRQVDSRVVCRVRDPGIVGVKPVLLDVRRLAGVVARVGFVDEGRLAGMARGLGQAKLGEQLELRVEFVRVGLDAALRMGRMHGGRQQ